VGEKLAPGQPWLIVAAGSAFLILVWIGCQIALREFCIRMAILAQTTNPSYFRELPVTAASSSGLRTVFLFASFASIPACLR
jgi:hypothetical protein